MNQGKLAGKMVAAMKDIDAVLKNGRNDFQKYNYVRAADVANEAREAMISHGIAFTYDVVDTEHWETTKEKDGKTSTNYFCQLTVMVTFTDADSGEQMSGRVVGWGSDTLDKAPFKAMTGAVKYALRMNFLIPDENDPEDTTIEQLREANKQQPQVQRAVKQNPDAEPPKDFDAHMDQSVEKQYPTPRVRPDGPRVSEAQAKRFFGIAMGSGKSKQQINNYLGSNSYERSDDMLKSEYEKHCEWAAAK